MTPEKYKIHRSYNGEKVDAAGAELDYLHICDLDEFIVALQHVRNQTRGWTE